MIEKIKAKISQDPIFGYLLSAPLVIWVVFTLIYPLVQAVNLSFMNVGFVGSEGSYVGLRNYVGILQSKEFWSSFLKSSVWAGANVSLQVVFAFVMALILNQDFKGERFIRNWIVLPWVLPTIILAIMWRWILDPSFGILNFTLQRIGLTSSPILFLASKDNAMVTTIFINTWRWFPFFGIVILAALQTVPVQLYEAAEIDGASSLQKLFYITLPVILPVLKVIVLIGFLWAINIFDTIWLLTRGGPSDATTTLPIFVYDKGFQDFRISEASTVAVFMFILLLIFGLVYLRRIFATGNQE